VRHYGEPFGDSSAIPTYYLSRLARRYVPMTLSGDGGDEAFAGYNTYRSWMTLGAKERILERWISLIQYVACDVRTRLWRPEFRSVVSDKANAFDEAFGWARTYTPAQMVQYMDLRTYLPHCILTKVDIASMAHGLEVRTPLVDTEIWRLALSMPEQWNMRMEGGVWEGKLLLKSYLRHLLPAALVDRPKRGFAVPIDKWFRRGGALRGAVEARLYAADTPLLSYFNPAVIREIVLAERSGPVWLLLVLDEWLRQEGG